MEVRDASMTAAWSKEGVDLMARLASIDGDYYVMPRGECATLRFVAPPEKPGSARSWMIRTNGWYRIDASGIGEPRTARLNRLETDRLGVSRVSVEMMNRALENLRQAALAGR